VTAVNGKPPCMHAGTRHTIALISLIYKRKGLRETLIRFKIINYKIVIKSYILLIFVFLFNKILSLTTYIRISKNGSYRFIES